MAPAGVEVDDGNPVDLEDLLGKGGRNAGGVEQRVWRVARRQPVAAWATGERKAGEIIKQDHDRKRIRLSAIVSHLPSRQSFPETS